MLPRNKDPNYVKGVFSTQEIRKIGTGTTSRRTVQKGYWFIESLEDGSLECQPLNSNLVPAGAKRIITRDELMSKYAPEPEFYMSSVFPKMQELQQAVEAGDECRKNGENFAAELGYGTALSIDIDNIRANFGIGITYLERGEGDKAKNIFERLLKLEGTFEKTHKHLFNEFGISLRKNSMYAESLEYYQRAMELTEADENLYFNLARVHLEMKDFTNCLEYLLKALELAPTHETGLKFLDWMERKNLVPATYASKVAKFKQ